MFKKLPKIISTLLVVPFLVTVVSPTSAAPAHQAAACSQDYNVQADDWLSKLADKFLGDVQAFPLIVDSTNAAALADGSYASIANPDLIEIGWKLCLPDSADGQMAMEVMAPKDESGAMDASGAMASETNFNVRVENVGDFNYKSSGVFNTPLDASEPGPLLPGGAYEFNFDAAPGDRLSFATMFVQSNDLFIGPDTAGIALFNEAGSPVSGDITDQILFWDAGTEINQEPGLGADQPLSQAGPDTGAPDTEPAVRLAANEFGNLPAVSDLVSVSLGNTGPNSFVVRIDSITDGPILATSAGNTVPAPFAPGVWVVHPEGSSLFVEGSPDLGLGLEALAEDGDPSELATALASQSGLVTPFAPGVWAVHVANDPLFTAGQSDRGEGLEALAEDGNPADLNEALANRQGVIRSGVFNTPVGAAGPGPLLPGEAYEFSFAATPGDYLSLATMFVQSNDLFYAPDGAGIVLFDAAGTPLNGDITGQIGLWDAGTEVNQQPGFGADQAPRQAGANSGAAENGVVQPVADGLTYPAVNDTIRVIITTEQ
jgi:hypothetical protein